MHDPASELRRTYIQRLGEYEHEEGRGSDALALVHRIRYPLEGPTRKRRLTRLVLDGVGQGG
jgi:hypothetical protein